MLSLLGGAGKGYNDGTQQALENRRRAALDQIALDRNARDATVFGQEQEDRAAMRKAGESVTAVPDLVTDADGNQVQRQIKPDDVDNADVGTPGASPNLPAQRVGMQGLLTPEKAAAEAARQNTPEAMRARQLAELQKQSPEKAAALQAHDLTLKNTQIDLAAKEYDAGMNKAASRGLGSLVDWTNNSGSSDFKAKLVVSADGKTGEIHEVQPDGTLKPTGLSFANTAQGAAEAATMLARTVPPTAKLKHYMDVKESDRKESHDLATESYQNRMAGVAEKNAETNEQYRKDMGDAAGLRAEKAGTSKSAVDRMSESDKLTFADINKQRETINAAITKAQAEGMWDDKAPGSQQLQTRLNALNMRAQAMTSKYERDGASGAADPLGVRKPAASAGGVDTKIDPAVQSGRDAEAGKLMVRQEFGGDLARAQSELVAMQDGIKRAPKGEARTMLESQAARLQAGIAAMKADGGPMQQRAAGTREPPPIVPAGAPPVAARPTMQATAAAAQPFAPQATGDAALNAIEAGNVAAMKPLNDAVVTAQAQLAAVAKSGDPAALQRYAAALTQARAAREQAAQQKFGNRAPQYLASVGA
ncbi:MAG TPA: hypothetical protein VNU71_03455 [Burkholderiaceae bacterium]|nr:hypothetical protein [Burkholderiaceae bacterium]